MLGLAARLAAQGIGRPPVFDAAGLEVRNTLQFEGAIGFDDDAPWYGSTGLRVRRDWSRVGVAVGAAWLAAREPGYALSVAAQFKPGRHLLYGGEERALWLSGGPILDVTRVANDPLGSEYAIAGAAALVAMFGFPGFTIELSGAPRFEQRFMSHDGSSKRENAWGVQSGVVAGVARFVQLLLLVDWTNQGVRAPGAPEAGGTWTLGAGLRTRLPG
jgi:hypothetical protein